MNEENEILTYLASIWPESASITKMIGQTKLPIRTVTRLVRELENSKRLEVKAHSYFSGYRLTHAEATTQGCDMRPKVPSRTLNIYKAEPLKFKPMQCARDEARQVEELMSRRGDSFVPFKPPIHMGSQIPGGMQ